MTDAEPTDTQVIRRAASMITWLRSHVTRKMVGMVAGGVAAVAVWLWTFIGGVHDLGIKVDQVSIQVAKLADAIEKQKKQDTDFAVLQQRVSDMDSRLNKLEAWKDFADREVEKPDPRLRRRTR